MKNTKNTDKMTIEEIQKMINLLPIDQQKELKKGLKTSKSGKCRTEHNEIGILFEVSSDLLDYSKQFSISKDGNKNYRVLFDDKMGEIPNSNNGKTVLKYIVTVLEYDLEFKKS